MGPVRYVCVIVITSLVLAGGLSGCSKTSPSMRVWGTVTYQGKPVDEGQIIFTPTTDGGGPSTGATITSGRYELEKATGPYAGNTYRVEITAFGPAQSYSPNASGQGMTATVRPQLLPDNYNRTSTLSATISAEPDKNQHDFLLD